MALTYSYRLATDLFFPDANTGVVVVILITSSGINSLAFSCLPWRLLFAVTIKKKQKKTCPLRFDIFLYIYSKDNFNVYKKLFMMMYTFSVNVVLLVISFSRKHGILRRKCLYIFDEQKVLKIIICLCLAY